MDDLPQVRALASPLRTPEDLDPVLDRVGDVARIVLLGEASHGTHEYYAWRAALTRRLIEEKGFSFVAVEGDWPECYEVNRCVKHRPGVDTSPRAVLDAFDRWPTWMWANEEVVAFTEWLRQHNAGRTADERVGFYGLDVYSLWSSMRSLLDYLREHEPQHLDVALQAARCFEPYAEDAQEYAFASRLAPTSCEPAVVELLDRLCQERSRHTRDDDPEARFSAEQNAAVAAGAERYYRSMLGGQTESWNVRDLHGGAARARPAAGPRAAARRMSDLRVSVVVITHNRRSELLRTLDRLAALPERPRVVVVDNASVDGTAEAVCRRHPDVVLLEPGENLGAVGRNVGVAVTTTPYVAFCDDDTWYDPGALSRAADLLDRHPQLAVVTASIVVEPRGELDAICEEMAQSPLAHPDGLPGHALLSFLAGVSVVRRSAFLQAGGFSARLWLGGEEELLASDLARAGWHMAYVPDVVAHHHASRARDAHLRRRHGIRNTLWFTWLRRPLPSALRRTAQLLVRLPRDRVTVAGVLDAVRGARWVLRERAVVPAHVERGYRALEPMQLRSRARRYVS